MHPSTRLSLILACIVTAAAIPLELHVDDGSALPSALKKATAEVNKQIPKMQTTLDQAEAGDSAAAERVRLAFGPQGVAHIPTIRENIRRIDVGNMPVSSKVPGDVEKQWGPINAITPFEYRESANHPLTTYPVEFGKLFNTGAPKGKTNAATVLHEAAHVFAHASDDHYTTGTKDMVPLGLVPGANVQPQGGYAAEDPVVGSNRNPITEDRLSPNFKAVRDSATNMHMNADSYALFGAVCDEQMARRRKRALMENDPVAYYLAKRDAASCKLPPGYLKKKAAENAAKKKAASVSTPAPKAVVEAAAKSAKEKAAPANGLASKAEVAKTTNKKAAGAASGDKKTIKGAKPAAAGKSISKTLAKVTKSTRPKVPKSSLSRGSLKGSKAKGPTTKASKASSRGKPSKSTNAKSIKANTSKASSKTAVKSNASKLGPSKAAPKKGTKPKVSPENRSSPKKGVAGAAKKGGVSGVKQTKKESSRSPVSRGKQTPKQSSNLSSLKASNAKSSKATSATRKATAAHPKAVGPKASKPGQKAIKVSAAPKKVEKVLPKAIVAPVKAAVLPKKKNGKP